MINYSVNELPNGFDLTSPNVLKGFEVFLERYVIETRHTNELTKMFKPQTVKNICDEFNQIINTQKAYPNLRLPLSIDKLINKLKMLYSVDANEDYIFSVVRLTILSIQMAVKDADIKEMLEIKSSMKPSILKGQLQIILYNTSLNHTAHRAILSDPNITAYLGEIFDALEQLDKLKQNNQVQTEALHQVELTESATSASVSTNSVTRTVTPAAKIIDTNAISSAVIDPSLLTSSNTSTHSAPQAIYAAEINNQLPLGFELASFEAQQSFGVSLANKENPIGDICGGKTVESLSSKFTQIMEMHKAYPNAGLALATNNLINAFKKHFNRDDNHIFTMVKLALLSLMNLSQMDDDPEGKKKFENDLDFRRSMLMVSFKIMLPYMGERAVSPTFFGGEEIPRLFEEVFNVLNQLKQNTQAQKEAAHKVEQVESIDPKATSTSVSTTSTARIVSSESKPLPASTSANNKAQQITASASSTNDIPVVKPPSSNTGHLPVFFSNIFARIYTSTHSSPQSSNTEPPPVSKSGPKR